MQRLGEVSDHKVPAKAIIVSGCMILFSPLVNAIPGVPVRSCCSLRPPAPS